MEVLTPPQLTPINGTAVRVGNVQTGRIPYPDQGRPSRHTHCSELNCISVWSHALVIDYVKNLLLIKMLRKHFRFKRKHLNKRSNNNDEITFSSEFILHIVDCSDLSTFHYTKDDKAISIE